MQNLRTSISQKDHNNRISFVWFLAVFISGICTGALILRFFAHESVSLWCVLHHEMIINGSIEFDILLRKCLKFPIILLLVLFISGFSAVSQPLEFAVVFLRAVATGLSVAYYYSAFAFRGFLIVVFLVLPFSVTTALILILASREALSLSSAMGRYVLNINCESDSNIKKYTAKFVLLLFFLIIICCVQCFLVMALKGIL